MMSVAQQTSDLALGFEPVVEFATVNETALFGAKIGGLGDHRAACVTINAPW